MLIALNRPAAGDPAANAVTADGLASSVNDNSPIPGAVFPYSDIIQVLFGLDGEETDVPASAASLGFKSAGLDEYFNK